MELVSLALPVWQQLDPLKWDRVEEDVIEASSGICESKTCHRKGARCPGLMGPGEGEILCA
jgi:hypothetical protein